MRPLFLTSYSWRSSRQSRSDPNLFKINLPLTCLSDRIEKKDLKEAAVVKLIEIPYLQHCATMQKGGELLVL